MFVARSYFKFSNAMTKKKFEDKLALPNYTNNDKMSLITNYGQTIWNHKMENQFPLINLANVNNMLSKSNLSEIEIKKMLNKKFKSKQYVQDLNVKSSLICVICIIYLIGFAVYPVKFYRYL